jgi:DNA-binding Xre family transcriptional regulator
MRVDLNRLKFDKELSQAELGNVLGIAQAQVSLMINGKRDIQQGLH